MNGSAAQPPWLQRGRSAPGALRPLTSPTPRRLFGVALACRRLRRSSRGGRGWRDPRSGQRSRGQLLQTARVRRRRSGNLRARRGARSRDTARLSGGAGRGRICGVAGRGRIGGVAGRGWGCGGAGRLLLESRRAVVSAHSRRDGVQTREHENRERCCRHDGCAHDTRTHDKGRVHRRASLVVTPRAALRPSMPEALGVPRRAVLHLTSVGFREAFGSR
jgi:hypothetical protein